MESGSPSPPQAAPATSDQAAGDVAEPPHLAPSLWLLPGWIVLAGLDLSVLNSVVESTRRYNFHCGSGELQRFFFLTLAACLFGLLALLQIDLHRRTSVPFLAHEAWLARLPILVGGAVFLAYFVVIPGAIQLFFKPARRTPPAAQVSPVIAPRPGPATDLSSRFAHPTPEGTTDAGPA